jgi:hypothetical protein
VSEPTIAELRRRDGPLCRLLEWSSHLQCYCECHELGDAVLSLSPVASVLACTRHALDFKVSPRRLVIARHEDWERSQVAEPKKKRKR